MLPPDWLPNSLIIGMPARLLNIGLFAAVPVLIGLLSSGRRRLSRWTAAAAAALLRPELAEPCSGSTRPRCCSPLPDSRPCWPSSIVGCRLKARTFEDHRDPCGPARRRLGAVTLSQPWRSSSLFSCREVRCSTSLGRTCATRAPDPVLAVAAAREGHLATAGDLSLVQLRTRRPVLIDGLTLDSLPYAIESGPTVDGILQDGLRHGSLCAARGCAARRQDSQLAESRRVGTLRHAAMAADSRAL